MMKTMAKILLVEDHPELGGAVLKELCDAGHHTELAPDGWTALRAFRRSRPDLVVLDWILPDIDGLEVLRRIRKDSDIPILMLTGRSDEADRVIGLEVGADDYLVKPFSMRELIVRIRVLLRRVELAHRIRTADRMVHSDPVSLGTLSLYPESHRATLAGEAIDLTRKEFALLDLFLRNPGRAFSRAYLLDEVWGESLVDGDRSVDNMVLRLRKKLGSSGDMIETVWGVGYRFHSAKE